MHLSLYAGEGSVSLFHRVGDSVFWLRLFKVVGVGYGILFECCF